MLHTTFSRRTALAAAALGTAAAVVGCSTTTPDQESQTTSTPNTRVPLPTYIPSPTAPKPDLPGSIDLMAAYLTYPKDRPASVADPAVPKGTTISVFGTQAQAVVPFAKNPLWQRIAEDMGGAVLDFRSVPSPTEQVQKLQTMIAGQDLPDIVQLANIPRLPEVLESRFADLTEHLSGDAVADYPNLAALPTWAWTSSVYNNRIYTLPIVRGKLGNIPIIRSDAFRDAGSPTLTNGEDFRALCRDVTRPSAQRWAIGQSPAAFAGMIAGMMGGPNGWAVDDKGVFTHMWETDEFAAALEQARAMYLDDKVFHPDAAAGVDQQAGFASGSMVLQYASYAVWPFLLRTYPDSAPTSFPLPRWDGGGPAAQPLLTKPFQFSGIAQAEPDRIKQLLRALDYWAAPFGTKEHAFTNDLHTDDERAQAPSPVSTVISAAPTVYLPGEPDAAKDLYQVQEGAVPGGVVDASVGLYSATAIAKGPAIDREAADQINGVTLGRIDPAQWPAAMDRWRANGGDKIREEYQEAHAAR